ncbi:MAG: hypothetical protein A2445_02350 [Candidatus Jacksonbacteria bacterium RIFOXYC2_FULL_44_29]|nr:MAG: hypothetical protein UW45_C0047G0006 [Parcubacteria group bacterium GW2011_GWC2_44_22]OGY75498.1 MAG: hypothetical protein A2240_03225 [Candidatus Jacksonbacteria bacterium RIFOXYA2_FULL_43_12]OGY75840.1 MAG: hypothetical protein A2295_00205 [Candidatus Jacksonbacteria bacterium RIFOXYB2_FULL_44_15]OGY79083.1 MAG: hypothetical protein A2445_02350 [Candidatus Jacksonbacteria bacterium RIFOXYC2_FULL_44_29]OGY80263.1 MAG: hypothetical protein A2550_03995 [Candidatus Jacksonbacteria bacteri
MKIYTFRVIIEPDENKTYHGFVPSLPGLNTWGESIEETKANVQDALKIYLMNMMDDQEPIPEETGYEFLQTITDSEIQAELKNPCAYA